MSPLERRALVALVSLIKDRESDPDEWVITDVRMKELQDACYEVAPAKSWERQRANQRRALRRALDRLHERGLVHATALAWVNVEDEAVLWWQGGGRRKTDSDGYRHGTPRWRLVGLTREGLAVAERLAAEGARP